MTLLLGAVTIGLILSLLALGIYISYRVFDIADITADGSITLGASIFAEAVRGLRADPRFFSKAFHIYCGHMYADGPSKEFFKTVLDRGYPELHAVLGVPAGRALLKKSLYCNPELCP